MRLPVFILTIAILTSSLLTGCSSSKKAKELARQQAQRSQAQTTQSPQNAPTRTASGPTNTATGSDWRITSIKSRYLHKDSSTIRVYMNVIGQKGQNFLTVEDLGARFVLNYVIYPDYNNRERLGYGSITLSTQNVTASVPDKEDHHLTVFFDFAKPKNIPNGVMLAEFVETSNGRKVLHDLPIRFRNTRLSDHYTFFDVKTGLPVMKNFATVNDTVLIRDVAGTTRSLQVVRYKHDFDAASSPMNTTPRPAPKSLNIDSTLTVSTNQPIQLPAEGLYLFLADTTEAYGVGLLVQDKRFPKLTRPEKLAKPILYMSTNQENGELNKATDVKKALDRYWLTLMSGNQDVARRTIRAYYGRVEEANRLFTTHKEGWKTDKGMIYIILGPPDRVQRSRDREVWVYNQRANVSEINFTFTRRPNQFVEDHYELVRYVEYQPIWYPVVEAWRTGAIRE